MALARTARARPRHARRPTAGPPPARVLANAQSHACTPLSTGAPAHAPTLRLTQACRPTGDPLSPSLAPSLPPSLPRSLAPSLPRSLPRVHDLPRVHVARPAASPSPRAGGASPGSGLCISRPTRPAAAPSPTSFTASPSRRTPGWCCILDSGLILTVSAAAPASVPRQSCTALHTALPRFPAPCCPSQKKH